MNTAAKTIAPIDAAYLALVTDHPLRPIRDNDGYRRASEILDRLAVREESSLAAGEQDYLETLVLLIADYDDKRHAIDTSRLTPLGLLKHLMQARDMTPGELGKALGSAPAASMILNGKRGLSKATIVKLAALFGVEPGLFLACPAVRPARPAAVKRVKASRRGGSGRKRGTGESRRAAAKRVG